MDNARLIFDDLRTRGLPLINEWVDEGYREDLHLDFKRKSHPMTSDISEDDRRNFSRSLSGFANSDGGLIIWGIGAPGSGSNIRTKHPINLVRNFAEHLDSLVSRYVAPSVDGVENYVVYERQKDNLGYVASYIPKSNSAPHRAEYQGLKHYYKRYGDSFKICEHYELEYMFGLRLNPSLKVIWGVEAEPHGGTNEYDCRLSIKLSNLGQAVARYPCLRLRYDSRSLYCMDHSFGPELIHYSEIHRASRAHYDMVTARGTSGLVIYPDDYITFFQFSFRGTEEEVTNPKLPKLALSYDLYGEHIRGIVNQEFIIPGRKIAEKVRKALADLNTETAS